MIEPAALLELEPLLDDVDDVPLDELCCELELPELPDEDDLLEPLLLDDELLDDDDDLPELLLDDDLFELLLLEVVEEDVAPR